MSRGVNFRHALIAPGAMRALTALVGLLAACCCGVSDASSPAASVPVPAPAAGQIQADNCPGILRAIRGNLTLTALAL